jgi:hypothetical protein
MIGQLKTVEDLSIEKQETYSMQKNFSTYRTTGYTKETQ